MLKKCSQCNHKLALNKFYKRTDSPCGIRSYCKDCSSKYHKEYNQRPGKKQANKQSRERLLPTGYWVYGNGKISNLKRRERQRGRSFTLTKEQLRKWWLENEDKCYYCGCSLSLFIKLRDFLVTHQNNNNCLISNFRALIGNRNSARTRNLTIDRIDNSKGYELTNMVKACWFCNKIKGSLLTKKEALLVAPSIIKRLQQAVDKLRPEIK